MAFDSSCELVGVVEAHDGKPTPFILVRIKCAESKEKFLLKCGEGVSWEVGHFLFVFNKLLKCIYFRNIVAQCLTRMVTCALLAKGN